MSNEITTKQDGSALISVIERLATSPDADIAKLEKMLDMQERVIKRNAQQAFTADLAAMQLELPRVIEHGEGHNKAKFAKLEDINDTVRPTLHKHGFAVTFRTKVEGPVILITTVLSHRNGHSEETVIPLPADTTGGKSAVQAIGSTISYGKRYGICALLNISTGDDTDGYKKPATTSLLVSEDQVSTLLNALHEKGIPVEKACAKLRVQDLRDLDASLYDAALKMIANTKGAPNASV